VVYRDYDLIIAGAGPVGCVVAERAANVMGWRCLIIEKRPHVAGNCYDFIDKNGLLLHQYGPHFFRTWSKSLVDYLGAFTEWIPGNHRVQARYMGELYPIPINLTTLEKFFKRELTQKSAQDLLNKKKSPSLILKTRKNSFYPKSAGSFMKPSIWDTPGSSGACIPGI